MERHVITCKPCIGAMQVGGFLSHVPGLNLGGVWEESTALSKWEQQLCLQKDLYAADVSGKQSAFLPGLNQTVSSINSFGDAAAESNSFAEWSGWLQNGTGLTSQWLSYSLSDISHPDYDVSAFDNQLSSVRDICANNNSKEVLLIVWLLFGGCCVCVVGVYVVMQHCKSRSFTPENAGWLRRICDWGLVQFVHSASEGLGSLAFYYYDLVTSVIVLVQVWGKWQRHVLIAIFLFHFAATALAVALHARQCLGSAQLETTSALCWRHVLTPMVCMLGAPFIPVVLVLDTLAFGQHLAATIDQIMHLSTTDSSVIKL